MIYREENSLVFRFDGEKLTITPWGQNSVRVRSVMMGEIINTDYALDKEPPFGGSSPKFLLEENRGELINGKIKVIMEQAPDKTGCRLSFYRTDGKLLLRELGDGGALKLKARDFVPITGGHMELKVSFEAWEEEKFFGMGQYQQNILDWKGCILELAHRNSQVSIPFVVSSRGYGFLWHNPSIGQAVFGNNVTRWEASCTRQMDYWVTAGDTPAEIIESYGDAVGKPPVMPEYALGFWQSKLRYWNQEQILSIAREYKDRGIPIDVIVCDYFHWPKLGDFRFDLDFFPDPAAMVRQLKDMGIELMVSVWPEVALDSENWPELQEKGMLIHPERGINILKTFGGDSSYYDATNPEARKRVWEICRKNYYQFGIRAFWLDDAEPNYQSLDYDHYRLYMGTNLEVGNLYPKMYARTFYEGMKEEGQEEIVNLVRCGWAGSQKYGALIWSGDIHSTYEDMRKQLCAGLNMGMAGIPWWTTDIGGFVGGNPEDERFRQLLIRWFQWGTFCPVMRLHGDRGPDGKVYGPDGTEAMRTGGDNEIWSFGENVFRILKKYIGIRESIRPYIRACMAEAHTLGAPVMRTMFYEFPKDPVCWELKEQYMLGNTLLVAPVFEEDISELSVYLPPEEQWFDFWTGEKIENGWQTVKTKLSTIPVFVRGSLKQTFHEMLLSEKGGTVCYTPK